LAAERTAEDLREGKVSPVKRRAFLPLPVVPLEELQRVGRSVVLEVDLVNREAAGRQDAPHLGRGPVWIGHVLEGRNGLREVEPLVFERQRLGRDAASVIDPPEERRGGRKRLERWKRRDLRGRVRPGPPPGKAFGRQEVLAERLEEEGRRREYL